MCPGMISATNCDGYIHTNLCKTLGDLGVTATFLQYQLPQVSLCLATKSCITLYWACKELTAVPSLDRSNQNWLIKYDQPIPKEYSPQVRLDRTTGWPETERTASVCPSPIGGELDLGFCNF